MATRHVWCLYISAGQVLGQNCSSTTADLTGVNSSATAYLEAIKFSCNDGAYIDVVWMRSNSWMSSFHVECTDGNDSEADQTLEGWTFASCGGGMRSIHTSETIGSGSPLPTNVYVSCYREEEGNLVFIGPWSVLGFVVFPALLRWLGGQNALSCYFGDAHQNMRHGMPNSYIIFS